MYLTIIILPLLGSIVSGFFGRKIGVTGSHILSCLCVITTTIFAVIAFFEVGFNNNPVSISLFKWFDSESFNIAWNFQFDSLTVSMLIPVLIISTLVHFYSIGYMGHDPHNQRFFSYLSLFTFMMIILVTGNNYLVMFVGWEGVGVCSYLLVSFWFTRIAANQSSLSAFLTNRVGDCFLTIGMFIILWSLGNLDYNTVFSLAPYINDNIVTTIGICLLIGAMAKSSQVGLHVWLPMAMEGPTPVSALIHAATMVTAGVYLLIRSSPLIEYSSTVLLICLWLGAITTVFSSLIGLFQQDIKKIIAYSTMSQLGMMVIAIGLSSYNVAIFHLINHAFYKGLLFLGAGAVIHAVVDNQDLRKYGGLRAFLPLTYTVILIASLSLVAFPFMTGFYSKDFILESAYGQYKFSSINVYVIAVIGAIFTTLYSVKVLYLTFLTNPNGSLNYYKNAHESDIFISLPLVILAIFSIYFGFITKDIYIGLGSGFFIDNSIFIHPIHEILINTEFGVPTIFKLIPFFLTLLFSGLALLYSEYIPNTIYNFKLSNLGYYVFGFFNQRFLIEYFYNKYIVNNVLFLGGQTTKVLDKGSIEWIGPYGINIILIKLSKMISILNKGVVTDYALYILVGICFYLSIFTFLSVFYDLMFCVTISSLLSLILLGYWDSRSKDIIFKDNSYNLISGLSVFSLIEYIKYILRSRFMLNLLVLLTFIIFTSDVSHFDSDDDDYYNSDGNDSNYKDKGKGIDTNPYDSEDEKDSNRKDKGKGIDTNPNRSEDENAESQKKNEQKTKDEWEKIRKYYEDNKSVTDKLSTMYNRMGEWDEKKLQAEREAFEALGILPDDNYHSKVPGFRQEDEPVLQDIRENKEKARIEEERETLGEASSSRTKRENDDSLDYKSDDSSTWNYTYKPPKKR
jgi:NADH-ubiquinone oxidoreductase chain 5